MSSVFLLHCLIIFILFGSVDVLSQFFQTLYQDIVSYERIVESLTEKAVDMAEKRHVGVRTSDSTANAVSRYCVIREQAKVGRDADHIWSIIICLDVGW